MSDKDPKSPPNKQPPGAPQQSGRVAYDSRGNPVWEWETSTGVYNRDVSTQRLQKLEANLSLMETQPVQTPKALAVQEVERLPGGGVNPYDSGGVAASRAPAAHPALVHKQPAPEKTSRKSLVSKYAAQKTPQPQKGLWDKLKARIKGDE